MEKTREHLDRDFSFPSSVVPADEVDVVIQEDNIARQPVRAPSLFYLFHVDIESWCIGNRPVMDTETGNWPISMKHSGEFNLMKLNYEASPLRLYPCRRSCPSVWRSSTEYVHAGDGVYNWDTGFDVRKVFEGCVVKWTLCDGCVNPRCERDVHKLDRDFWFPSSVVPAHEVDVVIQEDNIARHQPVRVPSLFRLFRVNIESLCIVVRNVPFQGSVRHYYLRNKNFDTFDTDIQQIKILKPGSSVGRSGFKRRNVREGPFEVVGMASSSAHAKVTNRNGPMKY
ncbi:hypothetical protein AZE42_07312 [Rhizopogon vesiculosus]|uniref:Uncharacterized protein n=1 Tax=Rhizopogon vesiculosus TaxID=180088 RepID=A0A1J8R3Z3_9AGAM|nr:hypothetical protein AZE42_07312 [Rhizopogon vesiculosus]